MHIQGLASEFNRQLVRLNRCDAVAHLPAWAATFSKALRGMLASIRALAHFDCRHATGSEQQSRDVTKVALPWWWWAASEEASQQLFSV